MAASNRHWKINIPKDKLNIHDKENERSKKAMINQITFDQKSIFRSIK